MTKWARQDLKDSLRHYIIIFLSVCVRECVFFISKTIIDIQVYHINDLLFDHWPSLS